MKKKWVILGTAMMAAVAITACGSKDTTATTVAVETTAEAASDTAAPESQAGTAEAGSGRRVRVRCRLGEQSCR